jgi:hypothetical protein
MFWKVDPLVNDSRGLAQLPSWWMNASYVKKRLPYMVGFEKW